MLGLLLHSALILWIVHRWEPGVVEKYRLRRLHLKVHQRPIHDAYAFVLREVRSNGDVTCGPKPGTGVVGWSCRGECHEGLFYSSIYFHLDFTASENKNKTPLGELRKKSFSCHVGRKLE